MAPQPSAVWVVREEDGLLDFLVSNVAQAGDGGNFKKVVFEQALVEIAPLHEHGPPKTVKMPGRSTVSFKRFNVSGWTWSDTDGCGITPESADTWDEYVRHHPEAKPFRNRGWRHVQRFEMLIPNSTPRGANVVYPSQTKQVTEDSDEEEHDGDDTEIEGTLSQSSTQSPATSQPSSSTPTTPPRSQRVRPKSGASAISDMAASVTRFGDAIAAALAPPPDLIASTPRCRIDALTAFGKNKKDRLSQIDFITMIDILHKDSTACDTYNIFVDKKNIREDWIEAQLLQATLKAQSVI
ncbi:hypothetical protein BKA70DRAFT_1428729 [Coprinopsis sp. MPI-PUGE-AT-0042]|nr:hypothetical protein BKA70DRAFT_1428729 [Coprinopsis sp. MPI-PUGE-AT-0042]